MRAFFIIVAVIVISKAAPMDRADKAGASGMGIYTPFGTGFTIAEDLKHSQFSARISKAVEEDDQLLAKNFILSSTSGYLGDADKEDFYNYSTDPSENEPAAYEDSSMSDAERQQLTTTDFGSTINDGRFVSDGNKMSIGAVNAENDVENVQLSASAKSNIVERFGVTDSDISKENDLEDVIATVGDLPMTDDYNEKLAAAKFGVIEPHEEGARDSGNLHSATASGKKQIVPSSRKRQQKKTNKAAEPKKQSGPTGKKRTESKATYDVDAFLNNAVKVAASEWAALPKFADENKHFWKEMRKEHSKYSVTLEHFIANEGSPNALITFMHDTWKGRGIDLPETAKSEHFVERVGRILMQPSADIPSVVTFAFNSLVVIIETLKESLPAAEEATDQAEIIFAEMESAFRREDKDQLQRLGAKLNNFSALINAKKLASTVADINLRCDDLRNLVPDVKLPDDYTVVGKRFEDLKSRLAHLHILVAD